ncbi:hypothetical protein THRCLA_22564 [Thraustotheca clavata]|uniref:Protein kinase domain-containing protein n=1 Tax=Thraustotheca clavata TaxID=74557 RepID=A0A1V9YX14_9STRA|nr:hypothetical protein THRCLA_22564 [Thraustotheca clavata]
MVLRALVTCKTPEVLTDDGQGHDGFPANIYSFVVLTDTPYASLNSSQFLILNRVCNGSLRPSVSDTCPTWSKKLADECMAYDPKARPTAIEIVRILRSHLFSKESTKERTEIVQVKVQPEVEPTKQRISNSVASSACGLTSSNSANINCPKCKQPNSLLNELCASCNKALLSVPAKINISVK